MNFPAFTTATFSKLPAAKQERILHTAGEEFALRGYEAARMATIAENAAVSVGALYKYFDGKQNLYLAVIHHSVAAMEDLLTSLSRTSEDILVKAEKIVREIQRFSRRERLLIKLYAGATAENDPVLVARFAAELETVTARIYRQAIREAQAMGDVRADIDAGFAAFLLNSLFMMLQFSYSNEYHMLRLKIYAGADVPERDDFVVEQVLKFIKSALR
ncbi:MAG: TetR/AcrR family transcriptional regulator [Oscillospiraceae bacterium]|nr:TetR/AcrR family transcriptional regulator [Oscillospiraceae bacterium]